ncbi:hypothetical protein CDAR_238841 [Caerostris darwini]|uniref:Uncharacterized protein n=1 Tax=Caerostris darwini TaxID=1538125 RepID=A0AAV4PVH8_9ARAC|nr:hypothetical protein CDAR_238841 [Caerostris darwini]
MAIRSSRQRALFAVRPDRPEWWNIANDYVEMIYDSRHHYRDNSQIEEFCAAAIIVPFSSGRTTQHPSSLIATLQLQIRTHLTCPPVPFIVRVQQPIPRLPI